MKDDIDEIFTLANHVDIVEPESYTEVIFAPYKGKTTFDSGSFYCPYIPLQTVNKEKIPELKIKTRYGLIRVVDDE